MLLKFHQLHWKFSFLMPQNLNSKIQIAICNANPLYLIASWCNYGSKKYLLSTIIKHCNRLSTHVKLHHCKRLLKKALLRSSFNWGDWMGSLEWLRGKNTREAGPGHRSSTGSWETINLTSKGNHIKVLSFTFTWFKNTWSPKPEY